MYEYHTNLNLKEFILIKSIGCNVACLMHVLSVNYHNRRQICIVVLWSLAPRLLLLQH